MILKNISKFEFYRVLFDITLVKPIQIMVLIAAEKTHNTEMCTPADNVVFSPNIGKLEKM